MVKGKNTSKLGALFLFVVILALAVSGCESKPKGSILVSGKNKSDFADMAGISMMDAVDKAQEKYQGNAIEAELGVEEGYLVWQVEIVGADKSIVEVAVDAGNGAILNTKKEKDKKY